MHDSKLSQNSPNIHTATHTIFVPQKCPIYIAEKSLTKTRLSGLKVRMNPRKISVAVDIEMLWTALYVMINMYLVQICIWIIYKYVYEYELVCYNEICDHVHKLYADVQIGSRHRAALVVPVSWSKEPSPPGGVSYLLCSLIKNCV